MNSYEFQHEANFFCLKKLKIESGQFCPQMRRPKIFEAEKNRSVFWCLLSTTTSTMTKKLAFQKCRVSSDQLSLHLWIVMFRAFQDLNPWRHLEWSNGNLVLTHLFCSTW